MSEFNFKHHWSTLNFLWIGFASRKRYERRSEAINCKDSAFTWCTIWNLNFQAKIFVDPYTELYVTTLYEFYTCKKIKGFLPKQSISNRKCNALSHTTLPNLQNFSFFFSGDLGVFWTLGFFKIVKSARTFWYHFWQ